MHSKETLPHPKNQYHIAGARGLHICDSPGFKYGLLHHQIGPGSVRDVHNHLSMGKILLQEIAHGFWRVSRHLPSQMMDLMACLEYVGAYIDDLSWITRGTLDDHIQDRGSAHQAAQCRPQS